MCLCYSQLEGMLGVKEMYTWLDVCGGCPFLFRGEFSGADVCPKCYEVRQCLLAVGWLLSGYCLAVVWLTRLGHAPLLSSLSLLASEPSSQ